MPTGTTPVGNRAVMYVRLGPTADGQRAMILRMCDQRGIGVESECNEPEDCAALIADGIVDLVVASHDAHDGLTSAIREVGGRVEYARRTFRLPTAKALLRLWHRQGRKPEEIARLMNSDTGEIRVIMRRMGLRPARPEQSRPPE